MPMRQVSAALLGVVTTAIAVIPGDIGVLRAASISQVSGNIPANYRAPAEYYGAIYLSSIDTVQPYPYILLAQGRLGSYTAVSWAGFIHREPGQSLFALLCGYRDATFTLRAFTEV